MTAEQAAEAKKVIRRAREELLTLLQLHTPEFESEWHGYVNDACAALRVALGRPIPGRLPHSTPIEP
jgi:hypothetical protein